jgi:hypothetical protein
MTIKDINPIDFANHIHDRIRDIEIFAPSAGDSYGAAARKAELVQLTDWVSKQIFTDKEHTKRCGFMRQAGCAK